MSIAAKLGFPVRKSLVGSLCLLWLAALLASPLCAQETQIVRDGSLGPGREVQPIAEPSPDGFGQVVRIGERLGVRPGGGENLFQSFERFDLGAGDRAVFEARPDLLTSNVIARVTGGSASLLSGTLASSIPGANLFFLNPAGIFVGPGASLDVQGSVFLSSATSLGLTDGVQFSTTPGAGDALLSMAPPEAFGFIAGASGDLSVEQSFLSVPSGATLSLTGRNLSVSESLVSAPGGRLVAQAVGSASSLPVLPEVRQANSLLGFRSPLSGNLTLRSALLDASDLAGGGLLLEGGNVSLVDSSVGSSSFGELRGAPTLILAGDALRISNSTVRNDGPAGALVLRARSLTIDGDSGIDGELLDSGSGLPASLAGSRVDIEADQISLVDSFIRRGTFSEAASGDVTLRAIDRLEISENGAIVAETAGPLAGRGGDVRILGGQISLVSGGQLGTRTLGSGSTGDLFLNVRRLETDAASFGSLATFDATGDSGSVNVVADEVFVLNSFPIGSIAWGGGDAGNLDFMVRDFRFVNSSGGLLSQQGTTGDLRIRAQNVLLSGDLGALANNGGPSGNIDIRADEVQLFGNLATQALTVGSGDISIVADRVQLGSNMPQSDTGFLFAFVVTGANEGVGSGEISIRSRELRAANSFVSAGALGFNVSGNLRVESDIVDLEASEFLGVAGVEIDAVELSARDGSIIAAETDFPDIFPEFRVGALGLTKGGDVRVTADQILLDTGSRISTTSFNDLSAGNLVIDADHIRLTNQSSLDSRSSGLRGSGGTVRVTAGDIELRSGALIATSTGGPGSAGNLDLNVRGRLLIDGTPLSPDVEIAPERGIRAEARLRSARAGISSSGVISSDPLSLPLTGNAGELRIRAGAIEVVNGAGITSSNEGTGRAGSIQLSADSISLSNAVIATEAVRGPTPGSVAEGNIRISASDALLVDGGTVSASVSSGQGGDVTLESGEVLLLREGTQVLARTDQGTGGRIRFDSPNVLQATNALVSADAGVGQAGLVEVSAPELNIDAELAGLELAFVDPSVRLRPSCELRDPESGSLTVRAPEFEPEFPDPAMLGPELPEDDRVVQASSAGGRARVPSRERVTVGSPSFARLRGLAVRAREALRSGRVADAVRLADAASEPLAAIRSAEAGTLLRLHLATTRLELLHARPELRKAQLPAAYAVLQPALKQIAELSDGRLRSHVFGLMGSLYVEDGRASDALILTRKALESSDASAEYAPEFRWHLQEARLLWDEGRGPASLDAYRRALRVLEAVRPGARDASFQGDAGFRSRVEPVYLELADRLLQRAALAESAGSDPTPLLIEARNTVEQLKVAELRNYFRDDCQAELEARTAELDRVAGDAAVVYPIALPDRLELLVRLPSGLSRFRVDVGAEQLAAEAERFRRGLQDRLSRSYLRSAQRLYGWLLEPFEQELERSGVTTLVYVPDAVLRSIPLSALHDGERYVAERYALAVTPGLSVVDPKPLRRENARLVLAGVSESVQDFSALSLVPDELEQIQSLFGGEILLDADFSAASIDAAVIDERPTILHVASHVVFTDDPSQSFVLTHDSRLGLNQLASTIARTRYREDPLELLVLSACRSAVDDPRAGLGLAGIAVRSGARSAVGTLWNLSDEASYELIVEFYRQLREPGLSRAEALRRAQVTLLRDPELSHPFYWSAFLLVNNWL